MKRTTRGLFALLLLAMVSPAPAHAAAAAWHRAATPHFVLYARADRDSVLRLARNLESMAEMLEREGFGVSAAERQRVIMVAFPNKKEFESHLPIRGGKRAEIAGLAHKTPFGIWIGFAAYDDRGRMVAHHELVHAIVDAALGFAPLCMNEGLAEFYSTWRATDRGGRYGEPIAWHQYVVAHDRPLSLDELFAIDNKSPAYARNGETQKLFYAESWAFIHYLMRLDGRSKRFRELALAIADGVPPRKAFSKTYAGESWEQIPGKLPDYVESGSIRAWEMRLAEPVSQLPVAIREAGDAEVATHVGMWRVFEDEVDANTTRAILEGVRGGSAEPGLALAGLGALGLRDSRPADAVKSCRAAAATPNATALALCVAGGSLLTHAVSGEPYDKALADEARRVLERSVTLDSTDAVALGWYGRAAVATGQLTPLAMRSLEKAATALPVDGAVASAWVAALSRTGQPERAREVLATHGGLSQNREARIATGATLAHDAFRDSAAALAKAGRYAELDRLLDRTEATTEDKQLIETVHSVRDQLVAARKQQRWVDRYNDGVRAQNANDLEKARIAFQAVRDSAVDEAMRVKAAARLGELAGMIEFQRGMKAYEKKDYAAAAAAFERARDLATTDDLRAQATKNAEMMRKAAAAKPAPKPKAK